MFFERRIGGSYDYPCEDAMGRSVASVVKDLVLCASRSLTALLREELALEVMPGEQKPVLSREHEAQLTEWMASHAAVSILPLSSAWDVEDRLIASDNPLVPLNLRGRAMSFLYP